MLELISRRILTRRLGKTAGMEWGTEKGSIEEEEEGREVRRLAAVFARADRVFASWSL